MRTVCSKCFTPLQPRIKKIRILPSGAICCDRCFFSRGKKESASSDRAQVLIRGGSSK